jgi:hypothetical protein
MDEQQKEEDIGDSRPDFPVRIAFDTHLAATSISYAVEVWTG